MFCLSHFPITKHLLLSILLPENLLTTGKYRAGEQGTPLPSFSLCRNARLHARWLASVGIGLVAVGQLVGRAQIAQQHNGST